MPKLGLGLSLPQTRITGSAPFSPADITGLALWLKPDAGLSFNGADEVTQWTDQSSVGNNFIQDLDYPAYREGDVINGYDGVLFEGGRLNGNSDIVTAKTIYAVVRTLGFQVEAYAAILECTGGSLYSAVNDVNWGSYFYNSGYSSSNSLAPNTSAIIATLSDDGENYEFRRDGASILSASNGGGFTSRSASYLGNDSGGGQFANVYISEIIVYDNVPSPANIALLEGYLMDKYAI
jgi:hypothetical protein